MSDDIEIEVDTKGFDDLVKTLLKIGDVQATITNDVFYVPRLEYGSSRQAPKGMVRVSLPEIRNVAQSMVGSIDWVKAVEGGKVREELTDRINRTADSGMQLIRDRTPIRTGRARRGWRVIEAK